jgi:hypothetical protein
MTDEVNDLLNALHLGTMSLDEVAKQFRQRSWPRRQSARTTTYTEIAQAEFQDPEAYIPGSFDDVTAAYHRGELSDQQYDVLATAMAESIQAEDARGAGE